VRKWKGVNNTVRLLAPPPTHPPTHPPARPSIHPPARPATRPPSHDRPLTTDRPLWTDRPTTREQGKEILQIVIEECEDVAVPLTKLADKGPTLNLLLGPKPAEK
jgi:hypothetical protein